ncbi:neuroglobin-like [Ptychodera flava]|uniref:neuroglobin-like n=1 Tax=Ptychodera flava TaxID=63121 RepID=UPI00396A8C12
MGCSVSKKHDPSRSSDVDPYAKKKPDDIDKRLPLTTRQRFQITKSWKGIARNMENTGKSMFMRLFQKNAELRRMFKNLGEFDDLEDMRESQQLENHASLVMYTIDEAIASLEDVDFVVELLKKIGRTHKRMDFHPELFWRIEQPFLAAVKETLEDRYTKNIEEIYKLTFKFIVDTLISGVKEAEGLDSDDGDDVVSNEAGGDDDDNREGQGKLYMNENDGTAESNNYDGQQGVDLIRNGKGR